MPPVHEYHGEKRLGGDRADPGSTGHPGFQSSRSQSPRTLEDVSHGNLGLKSSRGRETKRCLPPLGKGVTRGGHS